MVKSTKGTRSCFISLKQCGPDPVSSYPPHSSGPEKTDYFLKTGFHSAAKRQTSSYSSIKVPPNNNPPAENHAGGLFIVFGYLPVPIQVHLCQIYSNGPCLCLASHHLQNFSCNRNIKKPTDKLRVYPQ